MIKFSHFELDNGLKVILNTDKTTPMVAVNVLYDVGARDEHPGRTGFAHLFEHLMFGGSANIPSYDTPLQKAGGENNAFTSNDITNYYLSIPAQNIETAFWLESDRMLNLAFSKKSLDVQRNVVIEEFKQRYLNQPYGDTWLLLRPLAYKKHPYRWPTIGKDINHIANATMDDVRAFYEKHYHPANAVLSVVGNITEKELRLLCEKWFAPIRKGKKMKRSLPKEPVQTKKRTQSVTRNVPFDMICMAYHMCARKSKDYYTTDFISDILSSGHSSRLYTKLVKEKKIFSELDAYITGDFDEGLFVFQGKLMKGKSMKQAEESIIEEISQLQETLVEEKELQKIKNKAESAIEFNNVNILNRALKLAVAELLGDTGLINDEAERYDAVTAVDIRRLAKKIFAEKNCSVLYYKAGRKK
ncbi:MAG: pitrilysin family protein [Bacteroidales bacterium]|jgi:predicted Zn-dependent peptidase|nr:insulinase family protein [Bacteroidales bacterium]MDD4213337.1 pitrilysin family protein [Bacteroidales bacterium]